MHRGCENIRDRFKCTRNDYPCVHCTCEQPRCSIKVSLIDLCYNELVRPHRDRSSWLLQLPRVKGAPMCVGKVEIGIIICNGSEEV